MLRKLANLGTTAHASRERRTDTITNRRKRGAPPAPSRASRRLPLGSLRVFVAVAEHLSFTRAASSLGVTTGAASQQIRALEEYLGRPLFRRSGGRVALTAEGAALLPRVQRALYDLEHALDDSRGDRGGGPLHVSMLASFLQNWLLPRLPGLRLHYPEIDLQIHTSETAVDFIRTEQHAAIRFAASKSPGLTCEKLLDEWLVPVCTPDLLSEHGKLKDANDLARYPLIHSSSEPWTAWLLAGTRRYETKHGGPLLCPSDTSSPFTGARIDDSAAVVRLALQGYGIALARWSLTADDIAAGRLVVACDRPLRFARCYWLVYPKRNAALLSLRHFHDWLRAEVGKFSGPPGAER